MATTFNAIIQDVRACTLCSPLLPSAPRPIIQLHPEARILIAGQAPGLKTQTSGIPFDDPSGKRLREWMGIDKKQFYDSKKIAILPMGFCYPGSGKSGDLAPLQECGNKWRTLLLEQLTDIQLTLLIGQYAQKWHLTENRKANLTQTVKAWQQYQPSLIPLPHPSPRNNRWLKNNPWFTEELIPVLQQQIKKLI